MGGTEEVQPSEIAAPLAGELVASTPAWDEALMAPLDPSKLITGTLGELEDLERQVEAAKAAAKTAQEKADAEGHKTAERGLWTDHKRLAIEGIQHVVVDLTIAIQKQAEASALSFQMHRRTADAAYTLFQLGTRSVAANQMVYRYLYETLCGASEHKLGELAKQELERVMLQLKYQQDQAQQVIKLEENLAKREDKWSRERETLSGKIAATEKQLEAYGSGLGSLQETVVATQKRVDTEVANRGSDVRRLELALHAASANDDQLRDKAEQLSTALATLRSQVKRLQWVCGGSTFALAIVLAALIAWHFFAGH